MKSRLRGQAWPKELECQDIRKHLVRITLYSDFIPSSSHHCRIHPLYTILATYIHNSSQALKQQTPVKKTVKTKGVEVYPNDNHYTFVAHSYSYAQTSHSRTHIATPSTSLFHLHSNTQFMSANTITPRLRIVLSIYAQHTVLQHIQFIYQHQYIIQNGNLCYSENTQFRHTENIYHLILNRTCTIC